MPVVNVVSVVCPGQDVLDPRTGVDQSPPHAVVFESDQILVHVIVAGRVYVIEGLKSSLNYVFLFFGPVALVVEGRCLLFLAFSFAWMFTYLLFAVLFVSDIDFDCTFLAFFR